MKIEFEGETVMDIARQMELFLTQFGYRVDGFEGPGFVSETEITEVGDQPEQDEEGPSEKPSEEETPEETPEEETPEETPEETSEEAAQKQQPPESAKKDAVSALIELYTNHNGAQAEIKKLLKKYGVKKLGEVEDARGHELLADAEALKAKFETEDA